MLLQIAAMLQRLTLLLVGAAFYVACVLRHGVYRGHQRFYAAAQEGGFAGRGAAALLSSAPARLAVDYANFQASVDRDRITAMAAAEYADASLLGYGETEYNKGGDTIEEQQRGLILPLVLEGASRLPAGATIVEIGTGNGDVAMYLAERLPELEIVGVDLSVAAAQENHHAPNLRFVEGYALDLLEAGELDGALVFASSTVVVFTPLELARYLRALRSAGYEQIVLCEPSWGGYVGTRDGPASSRHLEGAVWHHNYAGYLRDAGYGITAFECRPHKHLLSPRPDIRLTFVSASR